MVQFISWKRQLRDEIFDFVRYDWQVGRGHSHDWPPALLEWYIDGRINLFAREKNPGRVSPFSVENSKRIVLDSSNLVVVTTNVEHEKSLLERGGNDKERVFSCHFYDILFYYGEGVGLINISSTVIMTDKTSSIVISHSSDPSTLVTFSVTAAR
jgi:hypothetical protein